MWFLALAIFCIVVVALLFLLVLFEPGLRYHVAAPPHALGSDEFLCLTGALADAQVHRDSRIDVLTNGGAFYEAQLDAIRTARASVNLEAYIFCKDAVGRRFVDALAERARAGVRVNVVVDAIGSFTTWDATFKALRDAGGRVCWYQPLRVGTLKRFNNRTHRELLIVDGAVGFIGGAGIGDDWLTGTRGEPPWRDTVVRVTGDLVLGLQTTFTENWLEAFDEILTGDEYFPACPRSTRDDAAGSGGAGGRGGDDADPTADVGGSGGGGDSGGADPNADVGDPDVDVAGLVVIGSPSAGRSSRARVLFQMLLASATHTIHINSPYFLPDPGVRRELVAAVKRGVSVKIITPGPHSDHLMTRRASRRLYGELLEGGCEIREYQPAMIHAKVLVIDDTWSAVGSTNFDNRSFGLNDEVNLALRCPAVARRLTEDFTKDAAESHPVTLEQWRRRPWSERVVEMLGSIIERQQ